jgi:hypothetical protein
MNRETQHIDWEKDRVFIYEFRKNIHLVNSIRDAIQRGGLITPVPLHKDFYGDYLLTPGEDEEDNKGGNHRAVAHYLEKAPLPFFNIPTSSDNPYYPISDVELFDHLTLKYEKERGDECEDFLERKKHYPNLDRDLIKRTKLELERLTS